MTWPWVEDLRITNMVRKPRGKSSSGEPRTIPAQRGPGQGLTEPGDPGLLLGTFTTRLGQKMDVIRVNPINTSRECRKCQPTRPRRTARAKRSFGASRAGMGNTRISTPPGSFWAGSHSNQHQPGDIRGIGHPSPGNGPCQPNTYPTRKRRSRNPLPEGREDVKRSRDSNVAGDTIGYRFAADRGRSGHPGEDGDMGIQYWVGAYSPDGGGTSQGICAIEYRDGTLIDLGVAHSADSPSWITAHPNLPVIYAALEHRGEIAAFRVVSSSRLEPLGKPVAAGNLLCHLALDATAGTLIASCYGDGKVLAYPIGTDGALGTPHLAEASEDPFIREGHDPRASRSHQSTLLSSGRIITTDLGHDSLRVWDLTDGKLELRQRITLHKGDGPRHLVEHPSGMIHVVTEHSVEVITLALDQAGDYQVLARSPLGDAFVAGEHYPAEISLDRGSQPTLYRGAWRRADSRAADRPERYPGTRRRAIMRR